jgi:hypothetical protein
MENVVGIIDMGDYQRNKKFFCKDLGALKIGEISASSYFFSILALLAVTSPKKIKTHVRGRDVCTNFHSGYFVSSKLCKLTSWTLPLHGRVVAFNSHTFVALLFVYVYLFYNTIDNSNINH